MSTLQNGQHRYSADEDDWIRKHIDDWDYPELTRRFNALYGTNIKSISDRAIKRLHLKKTVNRGNVKKGERRCVNTLPIGSERFNGQDVYVKIADSVNDCKYRRMPSKHDDANWTRKDYIVWAAHGNRIPNDSNEMLIHLNGDKRDCSIENLYLTSRKINLLMSKNKWYSTDRNITLAGLKWCEMFYAIRFCGEWRQT